ncbi:hypothetical protein [uncultured Vibrio sp.]|uniref:hypothetical protein n=1 Tax=uncultured Vibrio sp. TaxID=114054 RepID=UPI00262C7552|nr:hypothetical protein [uncultured Vibrio sp.]
MNMEINRYVRATLLLWVVALFFSFNVVASEESTGDKNSGKNTGQDPTRPMTRFDIRLEQGYLPFDAQGRDEQEGINTLIFRADAPILLGDKGQNGLLSLRMDIPLISLQRTFTREGSFELGSTYLQAVHIAPSSWGNLPGASAWGWGYAMQAPSSTTGRQEITHLGIYASKWQLSKTVSFVPLFKYMNASSEDNFDAINQLSFTPIINFNIGKGIDFVTLWGNYEWLLNFDDGELTGKQSGDYFIPYDVTVGKMLSDNRVVISATAAGELLSSSDFEQYDNKIMLRVGFFF